VIAAAPMRERRRGGVWVAGGVARHRRSQGAVSRCKAHFPSCVQNSSQAMTVTHVLATMVAERVMQRINQDYASYIYAADAVETTDIVHFLYWKQRSHTAPLLVLRSRSYRAPIVSGDCLNATSRTNNTWQSSSAHLGALVFDKTWYSIRHVGRRKEKCPKTYGFSIAPTIGANDRIGGKDAQFQRLKPLLGLLVECVVAGVLDCAMKT
jgi:hypothetical protein